MNITYVDKRHIKVGKDSVTNEQVGQSGGTPISSILLLAMTAGHICDLRSTLSVLWLHTRRVV